MRSGTGSPEQRAARGCRERTWNRELYKELTKTSVACAVRTAAHAQSSVKSPFCPESTVISR